jgi:hypothetical protein
MRVMVKFSFPAESGNEVISSGRIGPLFERLMNDLKPEAAYFYAADGNRAGHLIVNMQDASDIVEVGERFWHGLNATIEMTPVMTPEDLQKGLGSIETIVKNYGG